MPQVPPPQVGVSPPRVDGLAKVTGAARYVDDIQPPGVLFGRTVRSQVPHARLDAIKLDPDFDWSEVTVVTAEDLTGPNVIALITDDQPALVPVGGTIRHPDEPVALVAAPTKPLAEAARRAITLETTALEPVFSIEDSIAKTTLLHGEDNVFKRFEIKKGDLEVGFAEADHVIEGTYRTGAQEQMYIEPQGVIASWEGEGDEETVKLVGSLQCPYYVHKALKALYQLADERVIVTQAVTGGGFGGKEEYPSMISAHATLLARKAKRAVKLVYERDEDVAATTKRHPSRTIHKLGFKKDGTLVAADIDVVIDAGAYATLSEVVLSRAVLHAAGPYNIPHVRIVGRAVATNHPPHGAFRGFGAPQTTFAYERQIAKAAALVGQDPFVFRRHNMYRLGDVTATGQTLRESVATEEVLAAVEDTIAKPGPRQPLEGPSIKRGRGIAFYNHGAGFTGSGEERLKGQATLALLPDGRFEVRSSSTDIGQGAQTTFGQIAAMAAGLSADEIVVAQPSTDLVPDSGPTVASRTCMVVGHVVGQAASQLKEQVLAYAKEHDLDPDDRAAIAAHSPSELQATYTYRPPPGIVWDDQTYSGDAYPVFGWACCLVDLAVDTDTLEVTIERCVHAVDIGKAINPRIVQGQIEGGTLQALGWALWESVLYKEGRVLNQRMTNSIIPTSIEAPELEAVLVEVPYSHGPHGAKGVGEIPMDGPAAAVANALEQALGVATDEVPLLPETLDRLTRGGAA